MDALAFLERGDKAKILPLMVLHGDESFLKREALQMIRSRVLGDADDGEASVHAGDKATFAAVCDELETMPFFSPRRLLVVESADPFVTKFRGLLEKKINDLPKTAVLVLDVKTWPSNTRLAKMLDDAASILCKAPAAYRLPPWCVQWAASRYGKQLTNPAAAMLVDLIGAEMGLLDQELQKLAIYVGDRPKIDVAEVDKLVGNSRAENTFKIFDAIGAGQAGQALTILDRLFEQGEEPMRILGAFSMQLRRLAQAGRLAQQGLSLGAALERAGVPPFAVRNAEQQLRHIGRRRANRLYDWLLEVDFGMKGGSPLPERTLLERLVVRLARPQ
jgi:DNA polymerase III subunit delta